MALHSHALRCKAFQFLLQKAFVSRQTIFMNIMQSRKDYTRSWKAAKYQKNTQQTHFNHFWRYQWENTKHTQHFGSFKNKIYSFFSVIVFMSCSSLRGVSSHTGTTLCSPAPSWPSSPHYYLEVSMILHSICFACTGQTSPQGRPCQTLVTVSVAISYNNFFACLKCLNSWVVSITTFSSGFVYTPWKWWRPRSETRREGPPWILCMDPARSWGPLWVALFLFHWLVT